ncbi:hypothetical protein MSAN_02137100 [Mycena sanguinolenta]|uniref:Uncharacterized protein n=1 Tax=Mycena sanguinolenta TaxID=230812 RepID=A0A8H6XHM2_9AGAR|nr:hypothetical protein MSAN_02137100 [Mycena sanguinolenta]
MVSRYCQTYASATSEYCSDLWGGSSNGIRATLFNDDLILARHLMDRYRGSHFTTVYIYAHLYQDYSTAVDYIVSEFRQFDSGDCTLWIRRSTGRLCTELTPASHNLHIHLGSPYLPGLSRIYPDNAETVTAFIDSLTLEQYHNICAGSLEQWRSIALSADTVVNMGVVFRCSNNLFEDSVEIAFLPSARGPSLGNWRTSEHGGGKLMPNGWTCFQSGDVFNNTLCVSVWISWMTDRDIWLSQPNHIFRRMNIMSNFEDYVALHRVDYGLMISGPRGDPPVGFLFLCPKEDFQNSPFSFCWPACPAYWSLDPSGIDRLSPEDATRLGFPVFDLTASANGWYWDTRVYEGLREFHGAKGFDPYSQDVARHLGLPLFQLSSQCDAPVTSDGEDFDAYIDSICDSAYTEDYETEYSPSSACDDFDFDTESSDNQDLVGGNWGSEHTEIARCKKHDTSESAVEENMVAEEIFVPSRSSNVLMIIQLVLILFLGLSWTYDHVAVFLV